MAVRTGGKSGKPGLTETIKNESDYKSSLIQGTHEMETALTRDDLKLDVSAALGDTLAAQFGSRTGQSMYEGLANVAGLPTLALLYGLGTVSGGIPLVVYLSWLAVRQPDFGKAIGGILKKLGAEP